jgi:hypothetical protein
MDGGSIPAHDEVDIVFLPEPPEGGAEVGAGAVVLVLPEGVGVQEVEARGGHVGAPQRVLGGQQLEPALLVEGQVGRVHGHVVVPVVVAVVWRVEAPVEAPPPVGRVVVRVVAAPVRLVDVVVVVRVVSTA